MAVPAASHRIDGSPLTGNVGVRALKTVVGDTNTSLVLSWQNPTTASGDMTLLRDGVQIATLPAGTTSYEDKTLNAPASGIYRFNYTLVRNGVPLRCWRRSTTSNRSYWLTRCATIWLLTTASRRCRQPTARARPPSAPGSPAPMAALLSIDNFGGKALKVDSRIDAYQLMQSGADIALAPQFTIGFWFRSDCTQGNGTGEPILSNKDWTTRAATPGIAIGLWGNCSVSFNLGSGGKRDDIQGMTFSANQWTYLALSINATAKTFSAYVIDPVLGAAEDRETRPSPTPT
ncbi:hypothetical protein ACU4GD_07985 [Cupriavidus basilensis]